MGKNQKYSWKMYSAWNYEKEMEDLNKASDNPSAPNGITVILLSIVTCGIYQIYWYWKAGDGIREIGIRLNDNGVHVISD